jgi:thiol:disulfide interchange protein DsbC
VKLWPVHKQGVLGFGKAVEKMIQCLNNTLYTSAVVLRLKEQKVMIKKLGLALLTSAIASMSMASVESVQANLKRIIQILMFKIFKKQKCRAFIADL